MVEEPSAGSNLVGLGGSRGYSSWRQVSGYFDGDGSVSLEVVKYVLRFRVRFADTWKPQMDSIRSFLIRHGIRATGVNRDNAKDPLPAYRVEVGAVGSVLEVARFMLPFCVKKAEDLGITIDYLEGRITADEAVAKFNEEVRRGRRSGFIRESSMPYKRAQGIRLKQLENARKARAAYAVYVSPDVRDKIREDHAKLKVGFISLSKKYGYSPSVIRRILRG